MWILGRSAKRAFSETDRFLLFKNEKSIVSQYFGINRFTPKMRYFCKIVSQDFFLRNLEEGKPGEGFFTEKNSSDLLLRKIYFNVMYII